MTQDFASAVPVTGPSAVEPSAKVGLALRALRQSKGWSLSEVSSRIKFSPKQIEALENERWTDLPNGVSLRGLVRSYARLLGADSQSIVDSLDPDARIIGPLPLSPGFLQTAHVNVLFGDDEGLFGSWGWFLVIALLLFAGVVYAFWQNWLPQYWLMFEWFAKLSPRAQ